MKACLKIGLVNPQPGWVIAMRQLGLAFETIENYHSLNAAAYGAIIANKRLGDDQVEALAAYLRQGGAILDTGCLVTKYSQSAPTSKRIRTLFPGEDHPIFRHLPLIDLHSKVKVLKEARYMQNTVHLQRVASGVVAFLGWDVHRLLTDERRLRKQFYYPTRGRFPHEMVSRVSKGAVLLTVKALLKWLFFQRGLPYAHLWYYPHREPGIFAFRIDSDYASREQVNSWYELASRYQVRMTWFLHGEAHESWLSSFQQLRSQEFGIHGYHHHSYAGYQGNLDNIQRETKLFERHGLHYSGYAAPYGSWNRHLARAVENCQFTYASEFSLDYDNFPFFPRIEGRFSTVLQIPVHPICIGTLIHAKASEADMKRYFRYVIDQKRSQHEPLIFYDHLLHPHSSVVEDLFMRVRELGICNLTFGEYASWWKRRERMGYAASLEDGKLAVTFTDNDPSIRLCLHIAGRKMSFVDRKGVYALDRLSWQSSPEIPGGSAADLQRVRRFNPKLIQHSLQASYRRSKR